MSYDKMLKEIKNQAETPVGEVMVPIKMTVNHDDHIIKVIYDLTVTNVSIVPVMKDDKVVGVVRTMECLDEMAKIVL
jgi:predicted transcriptional regulator